MLLYIGITFWVFIILIIGLRPDSVLVAESWPNHPDKKIARTNERILEVFVYSTFLFLWFLTAFRSYRIGNDTMTYLYYFDVYTRGLDLSRTFEIGYQYLNYFIGKRTTDHHIFLIIIATMIYSGVILYVRKYSKNVAVSLCLFFCYFFSSFTSMFRQGIAMVIVLFGYQMLKEGKKIIAALMFLLAITFHTTALVCFLLFLNAEVLKKKRFVFGFTAFCAILSRTEFLNDVVERILPRYVHYFDSRYASTGWLAVTYSLMVYVIWYMLINRSINPGDKADRIVATNLTMLLIFAAFGYSVNLFTRAGEYFLLIAVTEIPNMLYRGKVKHYRLWLFGLCTMLLIMFIVTLIYRPGWNHIYPYEFWSKYDVF